MNAEEIREIRDKAMMTQDEFGSILGVQGKTVCAWEKGRQIPRPSRKRIIADIRDGKIKAHKPRA